jgi:hypothetical protein
VSYHRASIGEWGIDLHTSPFSLYNPETTPDIMSYCSGRWISLYTYRRLGSAINRVGDLGPGRATGPARIFWMAGEEVLVGTGYVSAEEIEFDSDTLYRTPLPEGEVISPDSGPYMVEVRDQQGNVLYTQAFGPTPHMDDPDPMQGVFFLVIPWFDGTKEIIFLHQGDQIGRVSVSRQAPQVALVTPNGGEALPEEGMVNVTWEASDADGDNLLSLIQYSPDAGVSWRVVQFDVEGLNAEIDVEALPGSTEALLRVCVSDGVNTTCDESDAVFTVPMKGPEVFITSPDDGLVFPSGEWVVMQGIAVDREDGSIPDGDSYTWHSSLDGVLGSGRALWGLPLSVGRHVLTLQAADSDGNVGSTSVEIVVGEQLGVGAETGAGEAGESGGENLVLLLLFLALAVLGGFLLVVAWLWTRKRSA